MKRKSFIISTMALALLHAVPSIAQISRRLRKGFKIAAEEDRYKKEMNTQPGSNSACKVSGEDTNGDMLIYEETHNRKGGPPLHIYHMQDEWFYVLEGEFIFKVGDETFRCKPGDSVFAPRKVSHT